MAKSFISAFAHNTLTTLLVPFYLAQIAYREAWKIKNENAIRLETVENNSARSSHGDIVHISEAHRKPSRRSSIESD